VTPQHETRQAFLAILTDPDLVGVGEDAIAEKLADRRARRESRPLAGYGLVICEPGATESDIIRMTVRDALLTAMVAIGNHVADRTKHATTGE
jgi:hypothetical protein